MSRNLLLAVCALTFASARAQVNVEPARSTVRVDFGKPVDRPLSKTKVGGVYQTPWVTAECLEREIPKIGEFGSRSVRYEIAWGQRGYGGEMITMGPDGSLAFDFAPLDRFTSLVAGQGANLVMSHSYNPKVAGGGAVDPPADMGVYREVNRAFARRWSELGLQNHYIEIWNEPDNAPAFFSREAAIEDYFRIYRTAAEGILEGDPDAKVGGPAAAFKEWHAPLLARCAEEGLPLDFLSGHNYGDPVPQLTAMREALIKAGRPDVEMLLTEYSPYIPWIGETWGGGLVERFEAAMTFFRAAETFLAYPDLTYVHWAQYIDAGGGSAISSDRRGDKMGLVDGNQGKRKALFNAFKIYGMMPVDRFELTGATDAVGGFASADPNNAGVVLWNTTKLHQNVALTMESLPFSRGEAKLYRVDPWNNSWYETGDDSLKVLQTIPVDSGRFTWEGGIPELSVVFLSLSDLSGKSELAANPFAHVIKTHHWFEDRLSPAYSDFDFRTWITRLGMGDRDAGNAVVGVYARDLPERFNVRFVFSGNGPRRVDENSSVNMRVDFEGGDGRYSRSVLFHGGLYERGREVSGDWGTRRSADRAVRVDLTDFDVRLSEYAPADWNGRAVITCQMQNTGAGSMAKVLVKRLE